ncbi:MAG: hypothetical protein GXY06_09265 [Clostridiaceae bacterium]|nr:hypothetical protein [Clostridiaceae bacterium]
MDHFSSPENVSPMLESEERTRLKRSLKMTASEDIVEKIMAELPLENSSAPEERADWVEKMSVLLENNFDGETVKKIRQNCYCNENGRLEKTAGVLKELYVSAGRDLNRFVEVVNERGAGWYVEGGRLFTKMLVCECPMLEAANISESLTWCHCTAGYNKKLFETVFEMPVEVEVVHSIRQGHDYCLLQIRRKQPGFPYESMS